MRLVCLMRQTRKHCSSPDSNIIIVECFNMHSGTPSASPRTYSLAGIIVVYRMILPYQCYMPCMYNAPVISSMLEPSSEALRLDVEERSVISVDCPGARWPVKWLSKRQLFMDISFLDALRPYLTCPPKYLSAGDTHP